MPNVTIDQHTVISNNIEEIKNCVESLKEEKTLREQLKEAQEKADYFEQKYAELVRKCNQYEDLLRDFDNVADRIIDNFNGIVNCIRIKYDEGFIRKNYKEMDFSTSGNIPVYIYKNETLRYIANFIISVRRYSKDNNYTTSDPSASIDRKERKLATRAFKSIKEYYKYLVS